MDQNTIIYLAVALGTAALIVGAGAAIIYFLSDSDGAKSVAEAAQIVTPFILIVTLVVLYRQLEHIQEQNIHTQVQNDLQRAVASKSAIQALNEFILDEKQKDFLRFLFFPKPIDASNDKSDLTPEEKQAAEEKQARETMMAFSLMNSLELLYLARDKKADDEARDKKADDEAFKGLLHGFTKNVRVHWKDSFPTVYHPEFQEIMKDVFDEMAKEESSGAEEGRAEQAKSDDLGGET